MDNDRTEEDRALRVQLEVHLDRQPVTGLLRPERGATETFIGWLEFVGALRRLQEGPADREEQP
jgi:hypothetical protein